MTKDEGVSLVEQVQQRTGLSDPSLATLWEWAHDHGTTVTALLR